MRRSNKWPDADDALLVLERVVRGEMNVPQIAIGHTNYLLAERVTQGTDGTEVKMFPI